MKFESSTFKSRKIPADLTHLSSGSVDCLLKDSVKQVADEHIENEEAAVSFTCLMLKETMCDSALAYALRSKSVVEDPWLADQIGDDLNTVERQRTGS